MLYLLKLEVQIKISQSDSCAKREQLATMSQSKNFDLKMSDIVDAWLDMISSENSLSLINLGRLKSVIAP